MEEVINLMNGLETNEGTKNELLQILKENERVYNRQTTFAKNFYHHIEITNKSPLKCNYPIPHYYKKRVDIEIEKMLKEKIIERSESQTRRRN